MRGVTRRSLRLVPSAGSTSARRQHHFLRGTQLITKGLRGATEHLHRPASGFMSQLTTVASAGGASHGAYCALGSNPSTLDSAAPHGACCALASNPSTLDSARQAPWLRRTADYAAWKDIPRILDKDTAARFPSNQYTLSSSYYRRRRKSDGTYILSYDDKVAIWYACLSLCAYHHTLTMHMLSSAPGTGK